MSESRCSQIGSRERLRHRHGIDIDHVRPASYAMQLVDLSSHPHTLSFDPAYVSSYNAYPEIETLLLLLPPITMSDPWHWIMDAARGCRSSAICGEAPHMGKLVAWGKLTAGEELFLEVIRLPPSTLGPCPTRLLPRLMVAKAIKLAAKPNHKGEDHVAQTSLPIMPDPPLLRSHALSPPPKASNSTCRYRLLLPVVDPASPNNTHHMEQGPSHNLVVNSDDEDVDEVLQVDSPALFTHSGKSKHIHRRSLSMFH